MSRDLKFSQLQNRYRTLSEYFEYVWNTSTFHEFSQAINFANKIFVIFGQKFHIVYRQYTLFSMSSGSQYIPFFLWRWSNIGSLDFHQTLFSSIWHSLPFSLAFLMITRMSNSNERTPLLHDTVVQMCMATAWSVPRI